MKPTIIFLTLITLCVLAPTAQADVLINAPSSTVICGAPIKVGIWAQPGTTGNRNVRISAYDTRTGKLWWRKTAYAKTSDWRYWYLASGYKGRCGRTKIVYKVYNDGGWSARYYVRFRSEGV